MNNSLVTFFTDGAKDTKQYIGDLGSIFIMWYDCNKHIETGGWVTIDDGKHCHFYDKPIII